MHWVCFMGGMSIGIPGIFIFIVVSQLPSRMGEELCASADHASASVSTVSETVCEVFERVIVLLLRSITTRRRGRRSSRRAAQVQEMYRPYQKRQKGSRGLGRWCTAAGCSRGRRQARLRQGQLR